MDGLSHEQPVERVAVVPVESARQESVLGGQLILRAGQLAQRNSSTAIRVRFSSEK